MHLEWYRFIELHERSNRARPMAAGFDVRRGTRMSTAMERTVGVALAVVVAAEIVLGIAAELLVVW